MFGPLGGQAEQAAACTFRRRQTGLAASSDPSAGDVLAGRPSHTPLPVMAPVEAPARNPHLGPRCARPLSVPPRPPSWSLPGMESQGLSPAWDGCASGPLSRPAGSGGWDRGIGRPLRQRSGGLAASLHLLHPHSPFPALSTEPPELLLSQRNGGRLFVRSTSIS